MGWWRLAKIHRLQQNRNRDSDLYLPTCNQVNAMDSDPLCCCEYTNSSGSRSHLLTLCCDCAELDMAVDNLVSGKNVASQRVNEILTVIEDRARIPWKGGAKKLPLDFIVPALVFPGVLWIMALSAQVMVVLLMVLPALAVMGIKWVVRLRPRTKLFLHWSYVSFIYLFYLYEVKAVGLLWDLPKLVSPWENLTLISLLTITAIFYKKLVHQAAQAPQGEFSKSKHCRQCEKSVVSRDHHCVWVNCCISAYNHASFRCFLLFCSMSAAHYALILTSYACPGIPLGPIVLPHICWPDSYDMRLLLVAGVYSGLLSGLLCTLLSVQITSSVMKGTLL